MKPIVEKLESGLNVVLQPFRAAPVVAFQMWVGAGSADEQLGEEGIAHVFEHMLFKGTEKRPVGEIARDVESAGGHINAWTSHDETVFFITLANRFWKQGLNILADAIQNPSLDRDELGRELAVIREEIRMGEDTPERVAIEKLFGNVYKKHPYGRPVIGYDRTVKQFTREMVADFYHRWYVPSNMVLVVAGDFDPRAMAKRVRSEFSVFRGGDPPKRTTRTSEPVQRGLRFASAQRPIAEAHLALGFPIPGIRHADVPALDLLAAIVGQGVSSRLETVVRRRLSLVTSARSLAYTPRDSGIFGVFAVTPPHQLEQANRAILDELYRVTREPVTSAEVAKSRTLLESDKVYSEETVEGIARKFGFYMLHTNDLSFEDKYLMALASKGPEDLLDVAQRYISPSRASVTTVVPDPARFKPQRRVSWIVGRGAARHVDGSKLKKVLCDQVKARAKLRDKKPVKLRHPSETVVTQLSTGDILIVRQDPSSKLVAARAAFLGGLRREPPSKAGVNTLLAVTLSRGTETMSAEEFAARMDALACNVGGFAGRNTIGAHGEFLRRNYDKGFELMAECLRRPAFPDDEVAREKELLIEEIRSSRDNPAQQVFRIFHQTLFGKHPYARPLYGEEKTVGRLERSDLLRCLKQSTSAGTMVLAVDGGADPEEVRELTERCFLSNHKKRRAPKDPSAWLPSKTPRQSSLNLPKEQSHVIVGFPGTRITSDDRFAVDVLIEILGGHGGRLFDGVREKRGLAYAVTATSMEGLEPGSVALYAATTPGQEKAVVQAMLEEVERIIRSRPAARELGRVKRFLIGAKAIAWQRAATRAASMSLDYIYGNGHDAGEQYASRIDVVDQEAVLRAARDYLDPSKVVIACVGPNAEALKF